MPHSDIGDWSQAKLEIVRDYGQEYSKILAKQKWLSHAYIDAFAGAGSHVSRTTGEMVPGSPQNALHISPPFSDYHFIDVDNEKVGALRELTKDQERVHIYEGDCNQLLLESVYPKVRREDYRRALCLLDPYGLHLDWQVIEKAGRMGSIEIFLNFPMLDINRNALAVDPWKAKPSHIERMNRFWGDDSWRSIVYDSETFFNLEYKRRASRSNLAAAFGQRLKDAAGFSYVPEPVVMRNSNNAMLYYLFFASPNSVANKIVTYIFDKYRTKDQDMLF